MDKFPPKCGECKKQLEPDFMRDIVQPEVYKLYDFRFTRYMFKEKFIYCIRCGCPHSPPEEGEEANTVCMECQMMFCYKCEVTWHAGETCEQCKLKKNVVRLDELALEELQRIGAKRCPKCNEYVIKNDGCNHMTCRFGHHFCWVCGVGFATASETYGHLHAVHRGIH